MAADQCTGIRYHTGYRYICALSNQPVAGKTGTTNNETDKWFCGFTPYYTASIWLGYDDNSKVLSKSISHTKIWQTIMSQIHEGLSTGEFTQPSGIVTAPSMLTVR